MPQSDVFSDTSSRFGLPFLVPGQAQKEFFVNEAHAILDAIVHPVIQSETASAPLEPETGKSWIVGAGAQGSFAGHEGDIANFNGSDWMFVQPAEGMMAFDLEKQKLRSFNGGWNDLLAVAAPVGGATIDVEARAAIDSLIDALRSFGLFPLS